jgi:hypothetical protein
MATLLRRSLVAALVTVVSGTGLVALAAPASAQAVESGVVKFGGDPGDYITGGQEYAYDTGLGDNVTVSGSPGNSTVSVGIDGVNGDWWTIDFDAPNSQPLTAGTTYTATRYPFNGAGAGFDLGGNGRGCNELTATFTVTEAEFGDNGYVASFHASFEQHCEGGTPAATGEVHITNPPPPAALEVTASVAPEGTVSPVSGRARVNGQVTCNYPTTVSLSGDLSQVVRGRIVRGQLSGSVACTPDTPATWTAIVTPSANRPFVTGKAEAYVTTTAHDEVYDRDVRSSVTSVTTLTESSPALADF